MIFHDIPMKIAETKTLENIQDWSLAIFCRLIQSPTTRRAQVSKRPSATALG